MTGPVSRYVRGEIEAKFRLHRVVVWYDPEEWFGEVARGLEGDGLEIAHLDEGYFALRSRLEPQVKALHRSGASLLIYVPRDPLPEERNVLLPLESLGVSFRRLPKTAVLRALEEDYPRHQIDEWNKLPGLTLERIDALATAGSEIAPLDAVFGKATPAQVGFELLRYPESAKKVVEQGLTDRLHDLITATFGVVVPPEVHEPEKLRDRFAQAVLVQEFLGDLVVVPPELQNLSVAESRSQVAACRQLCEKLRESRSLEEDYRRWAGDAQRRYGLEEPTYEPALLGRLETFEFENDLALEHVCGLASEQDWSAARRLANERVDSYWATTDRLRIVRWRIVRLAVDLYMAADEVLRDKPSGVSPADWIHWYAGAKAGVESATPEAWQVDRLLRELNALAVGAMVEDQLEKVVQAAQKKAESLEHQLAEEFVDAVSASGGELGDLPAQMSVFRRHVAPRLEAGGVKVALVLADALRYEMGRDLAGQLGEASEIQVELAIATPPTITSVGMAALVPGAEDGIELKQAGNKVRPVVAGRDLGGIVARRSLYQEAYGDRFLDLPLDRCLTTRQTSLNKAVARADLVLVRSQEIDAAGEIDNLAFARSVVGQMVASLQQAIQRLSRAGVKLFVITADHGFLLRPDVEDAMKLDLPSGEHIESHRRCLIGRGLARGPHHAVFRATDLGLGGDLEIAFPRGINVFKVGGGNLSYLHGGLSLQELVVPVIRYTPGAPPVEYGRSSRVEVELTGEKITVLFPRVKLRHMAADLLSERRRFRASLMDDDRTVGTVIQATRGYDEKRKEVSLDPDSEADLIFQLDSSLAGSGTLEIVVVDIELGETVAKEKVNYEISF